MLKVLDLQTHSCALRSSWPRGPTCIHLNMDFSAQLSSPEGICCQQCLVLAGFGDMCRPSAGDMILLTPPTYPHPLDGAGAQPVHRYPEADVPTGMSQMALDH